MEWMKWQWIQTHANYMPHEISTLLSVLWDKEATRNESGDSTRISSQDLLNTSLTTKALWPQKTRPQVHGLYTLFNYSWLIIIYAWSPVAWYRYDTYTRCHIIISAPQSIISRPPTNWANSNWAVSQGVSEDPNRHKRKSQLNEDKHLQCQHFHQNFKLFRSLWVPNEGVGELTGKMH